MTVQVKQNVKILGRNIEKNTPRISKKLSRAGARVDPAVVVSAAKYYDALKKLARE